MSDVIKIKKGLDLPISGEANRTLNDALNIRRYAVKPTDFVGLTPKLLVEEGATVEAGTPLICDKKEPNIRFTSPVNGTVASIVRGEKRALLAVVVESSTEKATGSKIDAPMNNANDVKNVMMQTGLWTAMRQRPFGIVARPDATPKAIFISAFDSAPLAPDFDFALDGRQNEVVKGLELISLLGNTHVCFRKGQRLAEEVKKINNINVHYVAGPHPAGNIGTQIAAISPINKGETVWTIGIQDVATLGHLALTGEYLPIRVVAVAGPNAQNPQYFRIVNGACVESIIAKISLNENTQGTGFRYISGNVLTGTRIQPNGYIGAYDSLISILPEGDYFGLLGWIAPNTRRFSLSRTFLSGFTAKCHCRKAIGKTDFDTNVHGGRRPFIFTGQFEQVFPFDIYPLQLIKACIIGDIDQMENLGIYEVEPEDFALCEFVDVSKTEIQTIIRGALEQLRKEAM